MRRSTILLIHISEETLMAKGMTQKKATKKKPAKTVKEKRADKVAKRKG